MGLFSDGFQISDLSPVNWVRPGTMSDGMMATGLATLAGGPAAGAAAASYFGGQETNAANRKMAQAQMDFQERMSSTAHYRQMQDLKRSGLNPLLAGKSGASSPTGASATMGNPLGEAASAGLTAAREIQNMQLQAARQKEDINYVRAQTGKTLVEAEVARKGIPESEIKNDVYQFLRRKFKDAKTSTALDPLAEAYGNLVYGSKHKQKPVPMKGPR